MKNIPDGRNGSHEVARDFGLQTKDITEILAKYATAPKNHMQVLEEHGGNSPVSSPVFRKYYP